MNNKELMVVIEQQLLENKEIVDRIKVDCTLLILNIRKGTKIVGNEFDSAEKIGDMIIDTLDAKTDTGFWVDIVDGPIAKKQMRKLLQSKWGQQFVNWFNNIKK